MYELAIVGEELNAAGCGLLMMVVSPAINGTIIARYGTDEQKQRWLPGHRGRLDHHGVRHHRARRRLQLAQHHHHRPPRRQRLGAQRPQDLRLRRRPRRRDPHRRPAPRTPRPAASSPRCSCSPPTRRASSTPPIDMDVVMPDKQFLLFLDDVRLPADALIGDEDAALAQLFAGLNPERIMAVGGLGRHGPLRAGQGRRVRQRARRLGQADRHPPGPRRTRSPRRRSSSSWPS